MSGWQKFGSDPDLERDGVWLSYGDYRVKVARAGENNPAFRKEVARFSTSRRGEVDTDVTLSAFCRHCILEWQTKVNGEFKRGIEVPPPEAKCGNDDAQAALASLRAEKLTADGLIPDTDVNRKLHLRCLPELAADIIEAATQSRTFQTQEIEDAGGNSVTSSSGESNTVRTPNESESRSDD